MDQLSLPIHARQWSASVLEVEPNCGTVELLQRLTRDDYAASAECIDAMQLLANPQAASLSAIAIQSATEAGTRAALEATVAGFANSFFEISPDQRQQQWETLQEDCQEFPKLTQWLNHLEPALPLSHIPELDDEAGDAFVKLCCESFVARDPERARRRQAIIHMYLHEPFPSQSVVAELQKAHREFVTAVVPWLPDLHTLFLSELAESTPWVLPLVAELRSYNPDFKWWVGYVIGFALFILAGVMSSQPSSRPLLDEIKTINRQHRLRDTRWGLKVEDAKDNPRLLRAARRATQILLGESPDATAIEDSEDVDEHPADALMPDQPGPVQ